MLDEQGGPKIADFGLAKNVESDSGLTATGQVMGTPSYMAPEQAAGKIDEVGPLSDVYAVGAITDGASGMSILGGQSMGSDTIIKALRIGPGRDQFRDGRFLRRGVSEQTLPLPHRPPPERGLGRAHEKGSTQKDEKEGSHRTSHSGPS